MTGTLIVRTDGSSELGTGHVMRCLTLAQSWCRAGGIVRFVSVDVPDGLRGRIDQWSDAVHTVEIQPGSQEDATRTTALAAEHDANWVVADGPHFDADYLTALTESSARVLLVDDEGERARYETDLVLNQNLHADREMYANRSADTELLLGPDYLLLRDEFLEWIDWSPDAASEPETLLVTLGGSDPVDATATVIQALDQINGDLETRIIVGAANDSLPDLVNLSEGVSQDINFKQNVSDMATQMAWADLAVSSGGTTCWELTYMGVPTVVGAVAPIERLTLVGLRREDLFNRVGMFEHAGADTVSESVERYMVDSSYRVKTSNRAQELIDGYGRRRVIDAME